MLLLRLFFLVMMQRVEMIKGGTTGRIADNSGETPASIRTIIRHLYRLLRIKQPRHTLTLTLPRILQVRQSQSYAFGPIHFRVILCCTEICLLGCRLNRNLIGSGINTTEARLIGAGFCASGKEG